MIRWLRLQRPEWLVEGYHWDPTHFPNVGPYDWVIHLGAITSTTETDVDAILRQNLEFSQRLFESCEYSRTNLQYASSASIYGLGKKFSESSPADPRNAYAWSKYLFDRWVFNQTQNIKVQGFRYFNVYGPHEDHKGDQASPVHKFRKQAIETGVIKLFEGSDHFKRDFVYVNDICRLHLLFIESVKGNGIWNVGTGKSTTFSHIAEVIAEQESARIELVNMPDNLESQYQKITCADISNLKKTVPDFTWLELKEYLDHDHKVSHYLG
jgi:ADP-L-glycero-D-manno-heptose 6-epimerase